MNKLEKENLENLRRCNRFSYCSANLCPLDTEASLRKLLVGENKCPFCLNKKSRLQKGMRTLAPADILQFVPKSNLKMLNRRSQNVWHTLQQKI